MRNSPFWWILAAESRSLVEHVFATDRPHRRTHRRNPRVPALPVRPGAPDFLAADSRTMTRVRAREPGSAALPASSPAFLATVLDLASDAIISVDLDGTILQTNRALCEMFDYGPGELVGRPLDALIPDRSRGRHRSLVAAFAASGAESARMAARAEIAGLRKDGSTFPAEASIARIETPAGPVLAAVIRDLTAIREAEDALRRQETLFRSVLDGSADLIALLDRSGRYLNANAAHGEVLGVPPDSLKGTEALALIHPDDRQAAVAWFLGHTSKTRESHKTLRLSTADGQVRWFEIRVTAVPGGAGQEDAVLLVSHDVSDRIAAEEHLLEREAMFRATFEQAAVGMAHVGLDGSWLMVNQRLCDITGYTRAELLDMKFAQLTHPDDLGSDLDALEAVVAGERQTFSAEKRYIRKSGETVWVHVTVSLRRQEDGTPLHFVVVTEDITERKATEVAAAAARATTEASLALLQATMDGLAAHVAVVDERGTIIQVNRAWRDFAAKAGEAWAPGDIGANYLEWCDPQTREALTGVLSGSRAEFRRESSCCAGEDLMWFVVTAARAEGLTGPLAVIAHEDVTELKRAQRDLERSAAALAVSLSAIALTDTDGRLTYVNRAFARMWGYPGEQPILGRPLTDFWAEPGRVGQVIRSLRIDQSWTGELRARRRGGEPFVVQVSATEITDESGEPKGTMFSCIDVSDRTLAEDELRRSQASLSRAQEVAGIGNWDWDIQTNGLWWSDQIFRIFGLEPQEFEATYPAFLDRVHPDDRRIVEEGVERALRGERYSIDHRVIRAHDGQVRIVHEIAEVVFSDEGRPLHMIGTVQDVTEARSMQNQLRQQRDLLSAVVGAAPVIILATDREGIFTLSDGKALARVGFQPGEVVGRSAFELYEDLPERAAAIRRALAGESVNLQITNGILVFDAFYGPLFGPDGDIEGVVGVAVDITERERLQEQLAQAQKMEAIGRLAGGIAHDFNNLLTVILTYSSLAHDALPEGSPIREDIDEVLKASKRASQLTQQLLSFARKQVVQVETFDLNRALLEVDRMLRRLLGSDVEFVMLFDEEAAHIRMDPGQFEQVVVNLVVNARDATPPGAPSRCAPYPWTSPTRPRHRRAGWSRGVTTESGLPTQGRGWMKKRFGARSSRSSPPREWGRARAWGSQPATASPSRPPGQSGSKVHLVQGLRLRLLLPRSRARAAPRRAGSPAKTACLRPAS